jgi:thioredoxin 1
MRRNMAIFFLLSMIAAACGTERTNAQGGTLDAKAFHQKMNATSEKAILDVRSPGEFVGGSIDGAVNMDYNGESFESDVAKLDKGKTYFVYCLSGGRSGSAAKYMRSAGFSEVYDMSGGLLVWQKEGLPLDNSKDNAPGMSQEQYSTLTTSAGKVLIDFYAPWCAPCKKMEPMLEELVSEYNGKVKIIRVNVDENKELARTLGIAEIPVFRYYVNGTATWEHNGYIEKEALIRVFQ